MRRCSSMRPGGQALVEFMLVSAALAFALFFPYLQGRSVTTLLLHALMECFRARSYLISIL
ncbi:MAG: hypothetical protein ABIQ86_02780 [Steroidobacteraceae bacterium]